MFLWSFVAHMALPIGEAGIRDIPNGQALLASMSSTLGGTSGLYLFPGMKGASFDENMKAFATNPSGLLLYRPAGTKYNFGAMLGIHLLHPNHRSAARRVSARADAHRDLCGPGGILRPCRPPRRHHHERRVLELGDSLLTHPALVLQQEPLAIQPAAVAR